jgi:hypothetical protein
MFVGANADEVPATEVSLASITVEASVEAAAGVARLPGHSHQPSKATVETRAMLNVRRTRTRSAKPNPARSSILLTLHLPINGEIHRFFRKEL